jgi:HD-like signal output (HDOD) protein
MTARNKIEEYLPRIKELPTLPTVLVRILHIAADPDGTALELGRLIASDQSLAASLLRLVNSPFYGFYRKIDSITQAIVLVGFFEVRRLALTATAFRTLRSSSTRFDHVQLWRHSLATAMAAECCAHAVNQPGHGCFESGLLHDLGKVALDLLCPKDYDRVLQYAYKEQTTLLAAEQTLLGIDHAEVGGLLGEHWNLPASVTEAIRCHHDPEKAHEFPHLAAITALANAITYKVNLGETSHPLPAPCPPHAMRCLGFTGEHEKVIEADLETNRERIEEFIGAVKSEG